MYGEFPATIRSTGMQYRSLPAIYGNSPEYFIVFERQRVEFIEASEKCTWLMRFVQVQSQQFLEKLKLKKILSSDEKITTIENINSNCICVIRIQKNRIICRFFSRARIKKSFHHQFVFFIINPIYIFLLTSKCIIYFCFHISKFKKY